VIHVVAYDPEGEFLSFDWDVPRATTRPTTFLEQEQNGDWVSILTLPNAWVRDGDIIEVTIITVIAMPPKNACRVT